MVGIAAGAGLGLEQGSARTLGGFGRGGLLGQTVLGRGGENVAVNAANGNLIVSRQDALLMGKGADVVSARTYNSQGLYDDDNGDNWRLSASRKVFGLTGAVSAAGSTISLLDWDGSQAVFTWDAGRNLYVSADGSGAYDTLSYDSGSDIWTFVDGASQASAQFDAARGGRLISASDPNGEVVTYSYNGAGLIAQVQSASGDRTFYDYDATDPALLVAVRQVYLDGNNVQQTLVATRYEYTSGRLSKVIVDLTPEDGSISDGAIYQTLYDYDSSGLLSSITQTDGSELQIAYDSSGRVETLTQTIAAGQTRTMSFAYATGETEATDALGQVTTYRYDSQSRLTDIEGPALAGGPQIWSFGYNANGDVISATDAANKTTFYEYDSAGNLVYQRDPSGQVVRRLYGAQNELLAITRYQGADTTNDGIADETAPLTTRYVYDADLNLRFVVDADGKVGETLYANGLPTGSLSYTEQSYGVSSLDPDDALTLSDMETWTAGITDKSSAVRIDYQYDLRGQLSGQTIYAATSAAGAGVANAGQDRHTLYVYDPFGRLLSVQSDAANSASETYLYDGLGRRIQLTNAQGAVTLTSYDDAQNRVVVSFDGLTTTSLYNRAGELIAQTESNGATSLSTSSYHYDVLGRLRYVEDPNGSRSYALYDAASRRIADIDSDGSLIEYLYDANDRRIASIAYATKLSAGQLASLVDGSGNPTAIGLSGGVRPAAHADDRHAWTLYDDSGRVLQTIDAAGAIVNYAYDGAGRLLETRGFAALYADLAGLKASPPAAPRTVAADTSNDRVTRYFYDGADRLIGQLDAEGGFTVHVYDEAGRKIESIAYATLATAALRAAGSFAALQTNVAGGADDIHQYSYYDGRGLLIAQVNGEGQIVRYHYNSNGYVDQESRGQKLTLTGVRPTLAQIEAAAADQLQIVKYDRSIYGQILTRTRILAGGDTSSTADDIVETDTYTYDDSRRLISEVLADGTGSTRTTLRRFDAQGRLVGELSGEGAAALAALGASPSQAQIDTVHATYGTRYVYDAGGRLVQKITPNGTNAGGLTTLYYYDSDNNLRFVVNALGEVTEYRYDSFGARTDELRYGVRLAPTTLAALDGGVLDAPALAAFAAIADPVKDSRTQQAFDVRGLTKNTTDAANRASSFAYNAFGQTIEISTPGPVSGVVKTAKVYDRRGLLTSTAIDPLGLNIATATAYDAFGRVIATTDARGVVRETSYDRAGRVHVIEDGFGLGETLSYDSLGRVLSRTDRMGAITSYAYDAFSRTITTTSPEGVQTRVKTNALGQTIEIKDGLNVLTTFTYDADGRLIAKTDDTGGLNVGLHSEYDFAGHLVEAVDARGIKTVYSYDAAGRVLTRVLDPVSALNPNGLGLTTAFEYDSKGQVVRTTDPAGKVTEFTYALDGQQTQIAIDPAGLNIRTQFSYDNAGNVKTMVEGYGTSAARTTAYEYDAAGRRTKTIVDPAGLNIGTTYTYDKAGNVVARTDALNNVTRFVYDAENRPIYEVNAEGAVAKTAYDANGRVITRTRFAAAISLTQPAPLPLGATTADVEARLSVSSSQDQTTRFYYDKDGRQIYDVDALGYVAQRSYDDAGRVLDVIRYADAVTVTDSTTAVQLAALVPSSLPSSARITEYGYDALGRVLTENVKLNDTQWALTQKAYDAAGNVAQITDARGNIGYFYYDAAGRLELQIDPEGYATRTTFTETGLTETVTRYAAQTAGAALGVPPSIASTPSKDATTSFEYDAAGRLTKSTDALGFYESFQYDAVGNQTQKRNKLGAIVNQTFDKAGNLTIERHENFIVKNGSGVDTVVQHRYEYDALGNRTKTTEAYGLPEARTTNYTYDKLNRLFTKSIVGLTGHIILDTGAPSTATVQAEKYFYDSFGNLIEMQDMAGARTLAYYDKLNRKEADLSPVGTLTTYEMDEVGNVVSQKMYETAIALPAYPSLTKPNAPSGDLREVIYIYDQNSRRIETRVYGVQVGDRISSGPDEGKYGVASDLISTHAVYDSMGNVVQEIDARENSSWSYYDALGRKIASVDSGRYLISYDLDANGNVTNETRYATKLSMAPNSASAVLDLIADAGTSANDRITDFTYDKNGQRLTQTRLHVEAATVDASGNLSTPATFAQRPSATITFTYNGLGQVRTKTEATGDVTEWVYDLEGRETSLKEQSFTAYVNSTTAQTLTPTTDTVYNGLGLIVSQTKHGQSPTYDRKTSFTYDSAGRLSTETDAENFTKNYLYDAASRIVRIQYGRTKSNGTQQQNASLVVYDNAGRQIWTAMAEWASGAWQIGDRTDYFYNSFGEMVLRGVNIGGRDANAQARAKEYAEYDQMGRVTYTNMGDGVDKAYSYDANGNATAMAMAQTSAIRGVSFNTIATNLLNYSLTLSVYDARNQLTDTYQPKVSNIGEYASIVTGGTDGTKTTGVFTATAVPAVDAGGNGTAVDLNVSGSVTVNSGGTVTYVSSYFSGGVSPMVFNGYVEGISKLPKYGTGSIFLRLPTGDTGPYSSTTNVISIPYPDGGANAKVMQNVGAAQVELATLAQGDNTIGKVIQVKSTGANISKLLMYVRDAGVNEPYTAVTLSQLTNSTGGVISGWFRASMQNAPFNGGASLVLTYYAYKSDGTIVDAKSGSTTAAGVPYLTDMPVNNATATTPVNGPGRVMVTESGATRYLIFSEAPIATAKVILRYRPKNSALGAAWTVYNSPNGMSNNGYGQDNVWAATITGINTDQEFWIECRDSSGNLIGNKKTFGYFNATTSASLAVSPTFPWHTDNPDKVTFTLPAGPAYANLKVFYKVAGQTEQSLDLPVGANKTVWDWDLTGVNIGGVTFDKYKAFTLESLRYEARDANGIIVHAAGTAAGATVKLGYSAPGAAAITTNLSGTQLPANVLFSVPQSTATKIRLSYRIAPAAGSQPSSANYTLVEINKGANGQYAWNVDAIRPASGAVTLEYYYDAYNASDVLLATQNGEDHQRGVVVIESNRYSNTDSTEITGYQINTNASEYLIHRSQGYNAFGEIVFEINGNQGRTTAEVAAEEILPIAQRTVRKTEYEYNTMGKLVRKLAPETNTTNEAGVTTRARPIERTFYDIAGRIVGVSDANGNETKYLLRAGSGYDENSPADIVKEFHADGGVKTFDRDIFGDARRIIGEEGAVTYQAFDQMGRLTQVTRPDGVGDANLVETYGYDELGQRVWRQDSVHGTAKEKTDYDLQGRVISTITFGARPTTYAYSFYSPQTGALGWDSNFVGWKITTTADGHSSDEYKDQFGRLIYKRDQGGHGFRYTYNKAGQLTLQAGSASVGSNSGQNVTYEYYQNGYVKRVVDHALGMESSFDYDNEGNRIRENYNSSDDAPIAKYYQNATAEFDELNRLIKFNDPDKATITYKFDLVGNRRNVRSSYFDGVNGTPRVQDYWYKYDSMNRFTLTMGALSAGVIGKGTDGTEIGYDKASQRVSATSANGTVETYLFTDDGYLYQVNINGVRRVTRTNDLLGRVTTYTEYLANQTINYTRATTYDADYRVTREVAQTRASNGSYDVSETDNVYKLYQDGNYTGADQGVLQASFVKSYNSATYNASNSSTWVSVDVGYLYNYWDDAKQYKITQQGTHLGNPNAANWKPGTTQFTYDQNGHVLRADINDASPRKIEYTTDAYGQVIVREERKGSYFYMMGARHLFYYYNGRRVGEVGNDGPSRDDYAQILAQDKNAKPEYRYFKPIASADFDQNYEPVSPTNPGATASQYTVNGGDTLQSIAQIMWGDSAMWYLIAEANGLTADDVLVEGQTLIIPNKITNIHNNSTTFRPYNPGEAIGDAMPILPPEPAPPPPPKHKKGCGVVGQIIAVVIAIVVTVATQGATAPYFASLGPTGAAVASGAIAGAVGAVASQGFLIASGAQSKFSWKGVAISAIAGGVSGGLGANKILDGKTFAQGALRGATANVITQGVSLATGLQKKFDWTGVAVSAAVGGVAKSAGGWAENHLQLSDWQTEAFTNTLGGFAGAATRSAIDGTDFGDALERAIPDVIGSSLGNLAAARIADDQAYARQQANIRRQGLVAGDNVAPVGNERNWLERNVLDPIGGFFKSAGNFLDDVFSQNLSAVIPSNPGTLLNDILVTSVKPGGWAESGLNFALRMSGIGKSPVAARAYQSFVGNYVSDYRYAQNQASVTWNAAVDAGKRSLQTNDGFGAAALKGQSLFLAAGAAGQYIASPITAVGVAYIGRPYAALTGGDMASARFMGEGVTMIASEGAGAFNLSGRTGRQVALSTRAEALTIEPEPMVTMFRGDATRRTDFLSDVAQRNGVSASDDFIARATQEGSVSSLFEDHALFSQGSPYISLTSSQDVAEHFARGFGGQQKGYVTEFRLPRRLVEPNFENPDLWEREFLAPSRIDPKYIVDQYQVPTRATR